MKGLDIFQMENVQGGEAANTICNGGFLGYGAIVTYGLALGGVSAGATALIGLGIGAIGCLVCSGFE